MIVPFPDKGNFVGEAVFRRKMSSVRDMLSVKNPWGVHIFTLRQLNV